MCALTSEFRLATSPSCSSILLTLCTKTSNISKTRAIFPLAAFCRSCLPNHTEGVPDWIAPHNETCATRRSIKIKTVGVFGEQARIKQQLPTS